MSKQLTTSSMAGTGRCLTAMPTSSTSPTNGGASFTDIGPLNPGPGNGNFLGGDPGVNCSDASTFYFSQIFDYTDSSSNNLFAAIAVNKSHDGGKTWGDPVAAISKDGFSHLLDNACSTIDPSHKRRVFGTSPDFRSTLA